MSATKKALREVLAALDGWIEDAKINHESMEHDDDCCTTFHPQDIRNMVEGAAQNIKAKKRRKKARATKPLGVIVEIEDGIAGTRHSRIITTGDTFTLNVPVTIKARIA